MPKYLKKDSCITRTNIHAVPVLSVFEENDTTLTMMLFLSKLPFLTHINEKGSLEYLVDRLPSQQIELSDAFQSQTQGDELTLVMNQRDFEKALQILIFLASCRLFNLRMMNGTENEVAHRRTVWHCLDLADAVHQTIGSPQALERKPEVQISHLIRIIGNSKSICLKPMPLNRIGLICQGRVQQCQKLVLCVRIWHYCVKL